MEVRKSLKTNPNGQLGVNLVLRAIQDAWSTYYMKDSKSDLVICCQLFPEPTEKEKRFHTGLHPAVFVDYTESNLFDDYLRKIWKSIDTQIRKGRKSINLYFVDRLGRYASMALAKVLVECALADPKLSLGRISTISNLRAMDCGPCDRCSMWDRRFRNKNAAVHCMVKKLLELDRTMSIPSNSGS